MDASSANVQESVDELVVLLTDDDEDVRIFAALQLGALGDAARAAVPALAELLRSDNVIDRRLAALTLGKIGPAASASVSRLVEALEDADDRVREFAVDALLLIQPDVEDRQAA